MDNGVVTPVDSVELTVKISDDNSGFKKDWSVRYLSLYYQAGNRSIRVDIYEYNEEENILKGKLEIPSYFSTGVYTIQSAYLRS